VRAVLGVAVPDRGPGVHQRIALHADKSGDVLDLEQGQRRARTLATRPRARGIEGVPGDGLKTSGLLSRSRSTLCRSMVAGHWARAGRSRCNPVAGNLFQFGDGSDRANNGDGKR